MHVYIRMVREQASQLMPSFWLCTCFADQVWIPSSNYEHFTFCCIQWMCNSEGQAVADFDGSWVSCTYEDLLEEVRHKQDCVFVVLNMSFQLEGTWGQHYEITALQEGP